METAYERAMRLRKKPEAQPEIAPVKKDTGAQLQTAMVNFWQRVDEKRKQGLTDTAILDGLSAGSSLLRGNITQSRMQYMKDPRIKNDRDLVNYLSVKFSGQMPTMKSVPLKVEKKAEEVPLPKKAMEVPSYVGEKAVKPVAETGLEFGRGMVKGGAETVFGLSALGQKGLEFFVGGPTRKILEEVGAKPTAPTPTAMETFKDTPALKAEGKAQEAGKMFENLMEFFIPGGAVAKLRHVKALKGLAPRAAIEGVSLAGVTTAQKGEVTSETFADFAIGAAFPVVGVGVKKYVTPIFEKVAEKSWRTILNKTASEIAKDTDNIAKEMSISGIAGRSRGAILEKIRTKITATNNKIDDLLMDHMKHPKDIEKLFVYGNRMVKPLEDLKKSYSMVPGEGSAVKIVDDIIKEIRGQNYNVIAAQNWKKKIYELIKKSYERDTSTVAKTESQKTIARSIKEQLEKAIKGDDIATLNKRESVLINARKAIEKAITKQEAKKFGVMDLLAPGTGYFILGPMGIVLSQAGKIAKDTAVTSTAAKMIREFNSLSSTQKFYYYNGIKALTTKYDDVIDYVNDKIKK